MFIPLEQNNLRIFNGDAERQIIGPRLRAQLLDVLVSLHHLYHHDLHLSHGQTFANAASGPTAEDERNEVLVFLLSSFSHRSGMNSWGFSKVSLL